MVFIMFNVIIIAATISLSLLLYIGLVFLKINIIQIILHNNDNIIYDYNTVHSLITDVINNNRAGAELSCEKKKLNRGLMYTFFLIIRYD